MPGRNEIRLPRWQGRGGCGPAPSSDESGSAGAAPPGRRMPAPLLTAAPGTAPCWGGQRPAPRQAVAKHLTVLDRAGLVHGAAAGRERRYRVDDAQLARAADQLADVGSSWDGRLRRIAASLPWPENVWMGVSVEANAQVWRARYLGEVPAAIRFVSAEPLLGPLDKLDLRGIDWLITGGESGHRHRPIEAQWVRDLRDRATAEGVAFFHKQWGGFRPKAGGRDLDGRTWDEWPTTVRTRWQGPALLVSPDGALLHPSQPEPATPA